MRGWRDSRPSTARGDAARAPSAGWSRSRRPPSPRPSPTSGPRAWAGTGPRSPRPGPPARASTTSAPGAAAACATLRGRRADGSARPPRTPRRTGAPRSPPERQNERTRILPSGVGQDDLVLQVAVHRHLPRVAVAASSALASPAKACQAGVRGWTGRCPSAAGHEPGVPHVEHGPTSRPSTRRRLPSAGFPATGNPRFAAGARPHPSHPESEPRCTSC